MESSRLANQEATELSSVASLISSYKVFCASTYDKSQIQRKIQWLNKGYNIVIESSSLEQALQSILDEKSSIQRELDKKWWFHSLIGESVYDLELGLRTLSEVEDMILSSMRKLSII